MLNLAIHFNYVKCSGIPGASLEPDHQVSSTAVSSIGSTDRPQTHHSFIGLGQPIAPQSHTASPKVGH